MKTLGILGLGGAAIAVAWTCIPTLAVAAQKDPPACAAITFRAVPSGQSDGVADAGIYKSPYGKIEVKATVKSGEPQDYFITFNGQKLKPVPATLPKTAATCATTKKLSVPDKAASPCLGERFTVLIDHSGKDRYMLLYSRSGRDSKFCSAGIV